MNNQGQNQGQNQGGITVGQGFQYDPVQDHYVIQDPNNTAAAGFNSPGTKQPYASNMANALQHYWNTNKPVTQVTDNIFRGNDLRF